MSVLRNAHPVNRFLCFLQLHVQSRYCGSISAACEYMYGKVYLRVQFEHEPPNAPLTVPVNF